MNRRQWNTEERRILDTMYVGDGSSDVHVVPHVNRCDGYTIAVSGNPFIVPAAKRTVLSDHALSVLVAILEDILKGNAQQIRQFFDSHGIALRDWDKVRTDRLSFHQEPLLPAPLERSFAN